MATSVSTRWYNQLTELSDHDRLEISRKVNKSCAEMKTVVVESGADCFVKVTYRLWIFSLDSRVSRTDDSEDRKTKMYLAKVIGTDSSALCP